MPKIDNGWLLDDSREAEYSIEIELHQPGKHDQQSHGNEKAQTKNSTRKYSDKKTSIASEEKQKDLEKSLEEYEERILNYAEEIQDKLGMRKKDLNVKVSREQIRSKKHGNVLGVFAMSKLRDDKEIYGYRYESEIVIYSKSSLLTERKNENEPITKLGEGFTVGKTYKDVLVHEAGHYIESWHMKFPFSFDLSDEYYKSVRSGIGLPSKYAAENISEFFSECFTAYYRRRDEFEKFNPSMFKFIENFMENELQLKSDVELSNIAQKVKSYEIFYSDGTVEWVDSLDFLERNSADVDIELAIGLAAFAELHGGEVHKNGTTQEVHGGGDGSESEVEDNSDLVELIDFKFDPEYTHKDAIDFAKERLKKVPRAILSQSRLASVELVDETFRATEIILEKYGEEGQGVFDRGNGAMIAATWNVDDSLEGMVDKNNRSPRIFWHEFAHSLDSLIVSDEYEEIFSRHDTFLDQDEDFANIFAEYMTVKEFGRGKDFTFSEAEKDMFRWFEELGL